MDKSTPSTFCLLTKCLKDIELEWYTTVSRSDLRTVISMTFVKGIDLGSHLLMRVMRQSRVLTNRCVNGISLHDKLTRPLMSPRLTNCKIAAMSAHEHMRAHTHTSHMHTHKQCTHCHVLVTVDTRLCVISVTWTVAYKPTDEYELGVFFGKPAFTDLIVSYTNFCRSQNQIHRARTRTSLITLLYIATNKQRLYQLYL